MMYSVSHSNLDRHFVYLKAWGRPLCGYPSLQPGDIGVTVNDLIADIACFTGL